jgi:hypothetical protein
MAQIIKRTAVGVRPAQAGLPSALAGSLRALGTAALVLLLS